MNANTRMCSSDLSRRSAGVRVIAVSRGLRHQGVQRAMQREFGIQVHRAHDARWARLPAFLEELSVCFIVVLDQELRTREPEQNEPAITDGLTIDFARLALIGEDQRPVAGAGTARPAGSEGRVSSEPMLVSPEPEEDAVQVRAQLATDARILGIEGAEPLMMAQEDHGAPVARVGEDDPLQPTAARPVESDEVNDELEEWEALGVVTRVHAHDTPMRVLKTQVARLLPERGEGEAKVAGTAGIHL